MNCANAKAGIASVMTGLAVALSAAPAHATYIYLTQSSAVSGSATLDLQRSQVFADLAPVESQTQGSDAAQTHGEMVLAGLQPQSAGVYEKESDGSDAGSGYNASYSALSGLRWSNARGAVRASSAFPWYLSDSTLSPAVATGSAAVISPAKDSPSGLGGVAAPSVPAATAPVPNTGNPTSPSLPNEIRLPPLHTIPIGSLPTEAPIVGVPSKTVPEPSTIGLLGIGLLLAFAGITRGKRARYYSGAVRR
jgi:hypothetical protein